MLYDIVNFLTTYQPSNVGRSQKTKPKNLSVLMFNVLFCDNNCNVFLLVGEHLKRRKRKGFETFAVSSSAYIYKKLKRSRKKSRIFSGRNPRKIQEEIHKEKYLRNLRSAAVVRFAGKATAGFAEGKQYCGWGQRQASTILRNIYCNTGTYY